MAKGDPLTSPWVWETHDESDRWVRVQVAFNETTHAIVAPGLTGTRDVGCVYTRIIIGPIDPETGEPDTANGGRAFAIPEGSFAVSRTALANNGYASIDDVTNTQFTLGT